MKIIQSKLLKRYKKLTHGFTNKQNGNLAFHVNDNKSSVIVNHQKLSNLLEYSMKDLVYMQQIHSSDVLKVTALHNFNNPPVCDALITDKKGIPLMVMGADCAPLLFYDTRCEVIAVAHVGRAGAFQNIIKSLIETFVAEYGSSVQDIVCAVGASIRVCCYEVGEEIVQEAHSLHMQESLQRREGKLFLNILTIIEDQLLSLGIQSNNIDIRECCTCCSEEEFSYRREKQTGREAGIIML
jgi:YfiH family protein